jgi:ATP phosphoribosyltransferase
VTGPAPVKLALPKGRLLPPTARLLQAAGLDLSDYSESTRNYNLSCARFPGLTGKIFQEKDIPIQVAVGNYDAGICSLDWVEELSARYPASALIKIASLGYGRTALWVAASRWGNIKSESDLDRRNGTFRLVSEYPNLAENFALSSRLGAFRVFPVWGSAEVYPPEGADLAVLRASGPSELAAKGLLAIKKLLPVSAWFVVNARAWEEKDLSPVLGCLAASVAALEPDPEPVEAPVSPVGPAPRWRPDAVWLAVPDGHQQKPALAFLEKAGVKLQGYAEGGKRPQADPDWIDVKVIRPQDMPQQVANGNFDLALSGRDWLLDHLARFPTSPVEHLADLGFGKVRIVAAMHESLGIRSLAELQAAVGAGRFQPLRVAAEYVNLMDRYLWDNHLSPSRLIPTWGASEAFLPEDADLLIENTETGQTLARHKLGIIDTLFESTACVIGRKGEADPPLKRERKAALVERFRQALRS